MCRCPGPLPRERLLHPDFSGQSQVGIFYPVPCRSHQFPTETFILNRALASPFPRRIFSCPLAFSPAHASLAIGRRGYPEVARAQSSQDLVKAEAEAWMAAAVPHHSAREAGGQAGRPGRVARAGRDAGLPSSAPSGSSSLGSRVPARWVAGSCPLSLLRWLLFSSCPF